jgi:hypothetical protein
MMHVPSISKCSTLIDFPVLSCFFTRPRLSHRTAAQPYFAKTVRLPLRWDYRPRCLGLCHGDARDVGDYSRTGRGKHVDA